MSFDPSDFSEKTGGFNPSDFSSPTGFNPSDFSSLNKASTGEAISDTWHNANASLARGTSGLLYGLGNAVMPNQEVMDADGTKHLRGYFDSSLDSAEQFAKEQEAKTSGKITTGFNRVFSAPAGLIQGIVGSGGGNAVNTMHNALDQGVSYPEAIGHGVIQQGVDTVGMGLPLGGSTLGTTVAKQVVAMPAIGTASDVAHTLLTSNPELLKEYQPWDLEKRGVEALTGGFLAAGMHGVGKVFPSKEGTSDPNESIKNKLDTLDQKPIDTTLIDDAGLQSQTDRPHSQSIPPETVHVPESEKLPLREDMGIQNDTNPLDHSARKNIADRLMDAFANGHIPDHLEGHAIEVLDALANKDITGRQAYKMMDPFYNTESNGLPIDYNLRGRQLENPDIPPAGKAGETTIPNKKGGEELSLVPMDKSRAEIIANVKEHADALKEQIAQWEGEGGTSVDPSLRTKAGSIDHLNDWEIAKSNKNNWAMQAMDARGRPKYFDHNTGEFRWALFLEDAKKNAKTAIEKAIFGLVQDILKSTQQSIKAEFRMTKEVDSSGNRVPEWQVRYQKRDGSTGLAVGHYKYDASKRHSIVLGGDALRDPLTIAHEFLHAATVNWIYSAQAHNTPNYRNLQKLYDHVTKYMLSNGMDAYGLTNVKEFVAELTNPTFQRTLRDIPMTGFKLEVSSRPTMKDALKQAFSILKDIFVKTDTTGIGIKGTAFEMALDLTGDAVAEYSAKRQLIDDFAYTLTDHDLHDLSDKQILTRKALNAVKRVSGVGDPMLGKLRPEPTPEERISGPLAEVFRNEFVSPDEPVQAVTERVLAEGAKEGPKYPLLQSGILSTAAKYKSELLTGIGRWFQNAQKRSTNDLKTYVQPLEVAFNKLVHQNLHVEAAAILQRERANQRRYTPEELTQAGFDPKVIDALTKFREYSDKLLENVNKQRVKQGMKPITGEDAYSAARWSGSFRIPVYFKGQGMNEAPVWYIAEHSKKAADGALEHLKSSIDPYKTKIDLDRSVLDTKAGKFGNNQLEAYDIIMKLLGEHNPIVAEMKAVMDKFQEDRAQNMQNFNKHFEKRAGTRGFEGDRPWIDPKQDAKDFLYQQLAYLKSGTEWHYTQDAASKATELLTHPDIRKNQPENVNYATLYAKEKLGFGNSELMRNIENAIQQALGYDKRVFTSANSGLKNMFYHWTFGMGNIPFMALQLAQTAFALPMGHEITKGMKMETMAASAIDAPSILLNWANSPLKPKMSDHQIEMMNYIISNHIADNTVRSDVTSLGKGELIQGAEQLSNISMVMGDYLGRTFTFVTFANALIAKGVPKAEAFKLAEERTAVTFTDMRSGEKPMIFSKMGVAGDLVSPLKSFTFSYLNQFHMVAKQAKEGNPVPLMKFLGVQMALSGAAGLPFIEDIDKTYAFLIDIANWGAASHVPTWMYNLSPKRFLLENLPAFLNTGVISSTTGVDFGTRVSAPSVGSSATALVPQIGIEMAEWASAGKIFLRPDMQTAQEALYSLSPRTAQNVEHMVLPAFKGQKENMFLNPHDPSRGEIHRTPDEQNTKMLGFESLAVAKKKETLFQESRISNWRNEKADALKRDDLPHYLHTQDKDNIKGTVKEIYKLGGSISGEELVKIVMSRELEPETLLKLKIRSGKITDIYQVQRAIEALEKYKEHYQ